MERCGENVCVMTYEYQIRVLPQIATSMQTLKESIAQEKGIDTRTIHAIRILKKSIDARQRTVYVNLKVIVYVNEEPQEPVYTPIHYPDVSSGKRVIVVGEGPAGIFAALRLIEAGLRPVILERGKNVHDRKMDLSQIPRKQSVNPESNYCFGEGGAGTYSDGKLYTRSKKRGNVDKILRVFCQHGASTDILADAHPHIGTDKLPAVIEAMRNTILRCGGEVHHQTRMTGIITDKKRKVIGVEAVELTTGEQITFRGPVILATGHSARDVYRFLADHRFEIEAKGIAVGVRLEHPSFLIDQIQYHSKQGRGKYLPAAEYSFVTQANGRGVYSFCMCPGGFVIPAATDKQQLVVNGMSPSHRTGKWSNSGMVVETHPEDIEGEEPLKMMYWQEYLEKMCWQQAGMKQTAPAQRMEDFVKGRISYDLPSSSYVPGLVSSPLHFWLPEQITERLRLGFLTFGKQCRGFLTNDATMIAVETRTSSPVRITRNADTLMHIGVEGLFPCGEGAGYAGGIVSAAIDGERCADNCTEYINRMK